MLREFAAGAAVAAGVFAVTVVAVGLLVVLFPHMRFSQWVQGVFFGEPQANPYMLLAPDRDASPRVLVSVADTGGTRQWPKVVADLDHLIRIPDRGHGYTPVVEHAWVSMVPEPVRSAGWLMRIPPVLLEQLLRQVALLAEDLRTITVTVWDARPYRVLRTEPVTGEIPTLPMSPEWRQE